MMDILFWVVVICLPLITINQLVSLVLNLNKADDWVMHNEIKSQNNAIYSKLDDIERKI